MKVLAIEDEIAIRDLITINLELVGYEVFTAEDYIVKPFETVELLARIEVVLRRCNKSSNIIKPNHLEVEAGTRIVKANNKQVYLTAKEYDLLVLFFVT